MSLGTSGVLSDMNCVTCLAPVSPSMPCTTPSLLQTEFNNISDTIGQVAARVAQAFRDPEKVTCALPTSANTVTVHRKSNVALAVALELPEQRAV